MTAAMIRRRDNGNEGNDMGRFDDQVVVITGGAKGQGRNHALAFAAKARAS